MAGITKKEKVESDPRLITPVVCGGVYHMRHKDPYGDDIRGLMISSYNEGTDAARGEIQLPRSRPEMVYQGKERLQEFKLIARAAALPGRPAK